MSLDLAGDVAIRPIAAEASGSGYWSLLNRLESAAIGVRLSDGSIRVRRTDPAACVLYGPYMRLPVGPYRLRFRCGVGRPRLAEQPVLGVEVIVLSRFQQAWRDFTAAELEAGGASLIFDVPPKHSIESEDAGRFEFRFFHLGNADFAITGVDLEPVAEPSPAIPSGLHWRMLGRLQKSWIGRRDRSGSVTVGRRQPAGCILYGGLPYLRLGRGQYRLTVRASAQRPCIAGQPVLGIEIFGQSRWRSRRRLMRLARRPETNGLRQVRRDVVAEELTSGAVSVEFSVPSDLALEAGADAPFDVRLHHLGGTALRIDAVDLVKLANDEPTVQAPLLRPSGRRRLVIIGNCQSETLRQGFAQSQTLGERFEAKYHFVDLQQNQREFVARDLESCDVLLVQDLRDWDKFPLRDCVSPTAEVIKFPLVRFASLWPFDAWNGPGDRDAHDREAPNLTFSYLDGLLGRLRKEIPDKEARFEAYRSLEWPGIVNYRRLHQLEARRLTNTDRQYGIAIGAHVLENFPTRRVFHTTVRPNWQIFNLLLQYVAKCLGVTEPVSLSERVDTLLREPQVPVHPAVARDLGVRWADEKTGYLVHGREATWEAYIRRYIAHYG